LHGGWPTPGRRCKSCCWTLAAGNAVVLKPPSATPYTALRIGQLAIEAGMPAGLLNIVPGDAEAGEALIRHCLLVEAPIYDDVVSSLSQLVAQFRIGRAIDRTTTFGPVIDARA
jgi:acyl-CoA reductase-like NAD-dependent aldehyde dehydrogenase